MDQDNSKPCEINYPIGCLDRWVKPSQPPCVDDYLISCEDQAFQHQALTARATFADGESPQQLARQQNLELALFLAIGFAALVLCVYAPRLWSKRQTAQAVLARGYGGIPNGFKRDARRVAVIALGVFAGLMAWSLWR
jgi:hypothetical protein